MLDNHELVKKLRSSKTSHGQAVVMLNNHMVAVAREVAEIVASEAVRCVGVAKQEIINDFEAGLKCTEDNEVPPF